MTDLQAKLKKVLSGDYFPRLGFVEPILYEEHGADNFAVTEEQAFADLADCGIDIVIGAKYNLPQSRSAVIRTLEMCEKAGVLYLVRDSESFTDRTFAEAADYFEKTYAELSKFKSFAGISPVDEPGYVSWDKIRKFRRAFEKIFPDKLYFVNLLQNYAPPWALTNGADKEDDLSPDGDYEFYCASYIKQADPKLFCYDFYPFREEYPKVKREYFQQLETALRYASEKEIPVWCFLQSASFPEMSGFARTPSFKEMLWQANTSLCYGTTGLAYFCYWMPYDDANWNDSFVDVCGNKTVTYYNAAKINDYLLRVGKYFSKSRVCKVLRSENALNISDFSEVISADGNGMVSCLKSGNSKYIFCVNGGFEKNEDITVSFNENVVSAIEVFGDTDVKIIGGKLHVNLAKGEGKLFLIKTVRSRT